MLKRIGNGNTVYVHKIKNTGKIPSDLSQGKILLSDLRFSAVMTRSIIFWDLMPYNEV
jgi:hypothetical protein